jgi:ABC-type hemin transport system ATPase subunit
MNFQYLVVAKIKERRAVSKQTTQRVHMKKFNLKKLKQIKGKEQYRVEISNRLAALGNLYAEVDINRACVSYRISVDGTPYHPSVAKC